MTDGDLNFKHPMSPDLCHRIDALDFIYEQLYLDDHF